MHCWRRMFKASVVMSSVKRWSTSSRNPRFWSRSLSRMNVVLISCCNRSRAPFKRRTISSAVKPASLTISPGIRRLRLILHSSAIPHMPHLSFPFTIEYRHKSSRTLAKYIWRDLICKQASWKFIFESCIHFWTRSIFFRISYQKGRRTKKLKVSMLFSSCSAAARVWCIPLVSADIRSSRSTISVIYFKISFQILINMLNVITTRKTHLAILLGKLKLLGK